MQSEIAGGRWTRRQFVRLSAGAAAATPLRSLFASSRDNASAGFGYATSIGTDGHGRIHVYAVNGNRWNLLEEHESHAPSFSCLSANGKTLYVANAVQEVAGRPRGSVTVYRVHAGGRLELLGEKPLSLGAITPRHMAILLGGDLLAVAATGGGILNLISIREDGSLGEIKAIRKETGGGPHPSQVFSQPHHLLYDSQGQHLLASDFGGDRVDVFALRGDQLVKRHSLPMDAGSGPTTVAKRGSALYVRHVLRGKLEVYGFDSDGGLLPEKLQSIALEGHAGSDVLVHPSGKVLYTAGPELQAWRIRNNGQLLSMKTLKGVASDRLILRGDAHLLYALDGENGTIRQISLDQDTGEPLVMQSVVKSDARWTSLSVLPA